MPENDQEKVIRDYERKSSNYVKNQSIDLNQQETDSFSGLSDNNESMTSTDDVEVTVESSTEMTTKTLENIHTNHQRLGKNETIFDDSQNIPNPDGSIVNFQSSNNTTNSESIPSTRSKEDNSAGSHPHSISSPASDTEEHEDGKADGFNSPSTKKDGNSQEITSQESPYKTPELNKSDNEQGAGGVPVNDVSQGVSSPASVPASDNMNHDLQNFVEDGTKKENENGQLGSNSEDNKNDNPNTDVINKSSDNIDDLNSNQQNNRRSAQRDTAENFGEGSKYRKNNISGHYGNYSGNKSNPNEVTNDAKDKSKNEALEKGADTAKKGIDAARKKAEAAKKTEESAKAVGTVVKASANWKLYLLIGAFIFFLLLLFFFLLVLAADNINQDSSQDQSTGLIDRSAPSSSYTTVPYDGVTDGKNYGVTRSHSDVNVFYTTLTEQEFVDKLTKATPSQSKYTSTFATFKNEQNARMIYRKGISDGVNPELAVLRPDVEGYSPASNGYTSKNNYWGFGCNNGEYLSTCTTFSSLDAGVDRFNKWIKDYASRTKSQYYSIVFHDYAQLYETWINDGYKIIDGKPNYDSCNWGLGGCCYSREVEKYLIEMGENDRAEEIKYACDVSHKAIARLPIDQDAYALYQTNKILESRQHIFGLDKDTIKSSTYIKKFITTDISSIVGKHSTLSPLIKQSYAELLKSNDTDINTINMQLADVVKSSVPGTREAVVNAAKFLVNSFAAYNVKLPYYFSGGHGEGGPVVTDYYGIHPSFGKRLSSGETYTTSSNMGLDCSGFVVWALRNGGLDFPILSTENFINQASTYKLINTNYSETVELVPGDLLVKNFYNQSKNKQEHHAMLIVDSYVKDGKNYVVTLEEINAGLAATIRERNDSYLSTYKIVHMDNWYKTKESVTQEEINSFYNKFTAGLIKGE